MDSIGVPWAEYRQRSEEGRRPNLPLDEPREAIWDSSALAREIPASREPFQGAGRRSGTTWQAIRDWPGRLVLALALALTLGTALVFGAGVDAASAWLKTMVLPSVWAFLGTATCCGFKR